MKRYWGLALSLSALLLVAATGAADAAKKPDAKDAPKSAEGAKAGGDKSFDDTVKDMEVIKGLFTFYRNADENKILMEILPDQLDKTFLFAASVDQAVGERGFYAAQMGGDFPFLFHRVGKSVQWIQKNTNFIADAGTPAARATARSFPNAILGTAKVQSKPHPERKSILIDTSELFSSSDLPGFAIGLNQAYSPTSFKFDKDKSAIVGLKAFPENVLLDVALHYSTDNPRTFSVTLPDPRSVPVVVKYGLSSLKETAYKPRLADDRVGHFHTVQQNFTSDHPSVPYTRYINRWNLEKTDPSAALSPPKQPIVFWLENTIPVEYREWITEGALLWNKAFERIGFKDAVVVKQQPDDADWDAADIRYNTIRWFAGVDATFAIGPSRANPFTGEIYDADIGISEGIIRNARRFGEEFVSPVAQKAEVWFPSAWTQSPRYLCSLGDGLTDQASLGMAVLDTRGMLSPEVESKLMHEYIVELTAHEVGHTLGLRHNFRASTILKPEELNNEEKTHALGQSGSVMDYNPIVIAGKGEPQGDFLQTTLGTYDYWAIEYAYKPIDGDPAEALNAIAARAASDPMLPYSTDEDAIGTFSARSIDPLANQYDQSTDPMIYFKKRIQIVNELWSSMATKLAKPGEGYQVLRRALSRGLGDYNRSLLTTSKLIGGVYHYRDHVGDPGGRAPFVPVPAAKQREALDFLSTYAFSEKAFQLPASVHNRLAVERLPALDWISYSNIQRLDYPWHNTVLALQSNVLDRLYNSITLGRIQDNELRFGPNQKAFRMADLFGGLTTSIWSELDGDAGEISSLRRNLQREHLKHLIRLTLRQQPQAVPAQFGPPAPPPPPAPEDATTLARASLTRIQAKIRKRIAAEKPLEATTQAHLQETQARIAAALEAQMQKELN